MKTHLISQAILKYLSSLMFLILLIFIPAGSLDFWKGWLLVGLVFLPMLLIGILLFLYKPDLLRKRTGNERERKGTKADHFFKCFTLSCYLYLSWFRLSFLLVSSPQPNHMVCKFHFSSILSPLC
ncbi:Mn2+-dependent serine/threonine protein kinase [Streptococcus milleri]|uniref:Mn2+-dependent serine/threonine protein kinase n=1 Tax=Streptococcus milleri TaxID=33040 RepID=A0A380L471_9STRE|nr:Mn2+-dependent serine/threonine protein kinase [Streptococcus milleri]